MSKRITLIKNILASNFSRMGSPYKITFAVTYKCNLKCKICSIWKNPIREEMDCGTIEKIFKSLKTLSWIDFTGGEITLRDDLMDIIKIIIRASKRIVLFHVSTNGQMPERTALLAKELAVAGVVPVINISIDGPKRINDSLRGIDGAYSYSLETFRLIRRIKNVHTYLSCTLSSLNIGHIDELLVNLKKDIPDFDFSELHFNLFHRSAHYYNNQNSNAPLGLPSHSLKRYLNMCKQGNPVKVFLEKEYIKELDVFLNNGRSSVPCQACLSSCFVNPYGEVYPCGIYNHIIANLKDYDFNLNALWNCEKSLAARRAIEEGKCPGCWTACEAYPAILGSFINGLFRKSFFY